ncbi:MAG: hypothetical protein AB8F74_14275 [Saprospiraceae bacterium]
MLPSSYRHWSVYVTSMLSDSFSSRKNHFSKFHEHSSLIDKSYGLSSNEAIRSGPNTLKTAPVAAQWEFWHVVYHAMLSKGINADFLPNAKYAPPRVKRGALVLSEIKFDKIYDEKVLADLGKL